MTVALGYFSAMNCFAAATSSRPDRYDRRRNHNKPFEKAERLYGRQMHVASPGFTLAASVSLLNNKKTIGTSVDSDQIAAAPTASYRFALAEACLHSKGGLDGIRVVLC
jgi:hypothetical protein